MQLQRSGGAQVAISPDVFQDVLEPAKVKGWQIVQGSRLQEQGDLEPVVNIHIVQKLRQSATGSARRRIETHMIYDQHQK